LWFVLEGVAIAICAAFLIYSSRPEQSPCEMPSSLFDTAWNATHAQSIATAFAATNRQHAPDSARRVGEIFDSYGKQWLGARKDACVATRVRGDQSEALLDARIRCLDRRRTELAELVRVLGDKPTAKIVDRAVQVANGELLNLTTCSAAGVQSEMPLPKDPERAKQITALEHEVATLRASLTLVTKTDEATKKAQGYVERAKQLDFAPLTSRAAVALARLGQFSTNHADTEKHLYDALVATAAAHDDRATAEIWTYLVTFTANTKGDPVAALQLLKPAEAALARVESSQMLRAQLHHSQAIALAMTDDFTGARAACEQARTEAPAAIDRAAIDALQCHVEQRLANLKEAAALCARAAETYERELGPHHPDLGFTLTAVALVAFERQQNKEARVAFERSLAILEKSVGERHVAYVMALSNFGMIESREGRFAEARRLYERAIAGFEAIKHPELVSALGNLGDLEHKLGNYDAARKHLQRSLEISEQVYGKESERAAQALYSLGSVAFDADDYKGAQAHYERMLAIATKIFGEKHPRTALALNGLGLVLDQLDDCKGSIAYSQRAVAAYEAIHGPDHHAVADTLTTLASCQMDLGDRRAVANIERAIAIRDRLEFDDEFQRGSTRWTAARALWKLGGDRARAVVLAKEARAHYEKTADEGAKNAVLREIDRWLASRQGKR
jgi:tetratricopeptide (TPR) repeat protein